MTELAFVVPEAISASFSNKAILISYLESVRAIQHPITPPPIMTTS